MKSLPLRIYDYYLAFYFTRVGALRYLHSFPTRRSSRSPCRYPWNGPTGTEVQRDLAVALGGPRPGAQDRKSTRLNSSHVSISYADFCFKKKNHIPKLRHKLQF